MKEYGFQEITTEEMMEVEGGKWYDAVLTGAGGIITSVAACGYVSGSGAAIATMSVGSLAACGPAGWAVLGVGVICGAATGAATYHAARH